MLTSRGKSKSWELLRESSSSIFFQFFFCCFKDKGVKESFSKRSSSFCEVSWKYNISSTSSVCNRSSLADPVAEKFVVVSVDASVS